MANKNDYKNFIDRIQNSISYHLRAKKDSEYSICVNFLINGNDKSIFNNEKSSVLSQVKSLADYYQPEKILIKFIINGETKIFDQDFSKGSSNLNDTSINNSYSLQNKISENINQANSLNGLGQLSVEDYIQKKLEEDRIQRKLERLENELNEKNNELNSLRIDLKQSNEDIIRLEDEKEELNQIIESKKTVRYWAGLTGDILESMGIKKESLKEPLAGLISSESAESNLIEKPNYEIDESDIVETNPEQSQREEIIILIKDFLSSLNNQKLSEVFVILSEIEQNKDITNEIIKHFNLKTK